jgi:hypothetical protein
VSPFQAGESRLRNVGVHDAELNYSATGPVAADRGNEKEAFERMHLAEMGRNVLRPAWVRKRCARKKSECTFARTLKKRQQSCRTPG